MNWWNEGLLYQISDVNAFSDDGLKGETISICLSFVLIIEWEHILPSSHLHTLLIKFIEVHILFSKQIRQQPTTCVKYMKVSVFWLFAKITLGKH